ncbi:MAG: cytochrome c-type biogenesis protein CcmH [Hyphomicrobiaceae bacterium]|nr:cytochrome c-type biogenesis protein CcmH [Hyphomicrobiaceae bacterium]
MSRLARLLAALVVLLGLAAPAFAVKPDEMLADPAMEARARAISTELRCLVCQNESIDDSNAPLARDLRLLVRERLTAGDSDRQVLDYLVDKYGEFVLLRPVFSLRNALLWLGPFLVLAIGGLVIVSKIRRRPAAPAAAAGGLTADEQRALDELMKNG